MCSCSAGVLRFLSTLSRDKVKVLTDKDVGNGALTRFLIQVVLDGIAVVPNVEPVEVRMHVSPGRDPSKRYFEWGTHSTISTSPSGRLNSDMSALAFLQ